MTDAKLKKDAAAIFQAGIDAVNPGACIRRNLWLDKQYLGIAKKRYLQAEIGNIYVIGAGKASASMARAVEQILNERLTDGVVVTKYGHAIPLQRVNVLEAGHPVPDDNSVAGAHAIMEMIARAGKGDLIIALISGGGSALMTSPAQGLTLHDKQALTRELLACGATIHEINTIRKHLSAIKGGHLCRALALDGPQMISLIISDVIGDEITVIASGATSPDTSTFHNCLEILEKYHFKDKIPLQIVTLIEKGCRGITPDTPKPGDPIFGRVSNVIIASLSDALEGCRRMAEQLGYRTVVLSSMIQGEAREVAKVLCAVAKEVDHSGNPLKSPACLLSGGETTVTLTGNGKGGRNMELALSAAIQLEKAKNIVLLSAGTDGTDGPTNAAGAFVSGSIVADAEKIGLSALLELNRNNSYNFFNKLNALHITGPTLTNVMDLQIFLINPDA